MSKDNAYLSDMLGAAKAIRRFIEKVSKEEFIANEEKYEAVNRKFEIIGEAARRLSPEAKQLFSEVPWKLVSAMRNILIHDYDDVNLNIVWDTAQKNLPPLIAKYGSLSRRTPADRRVKAGPRTTVRPLSQGTRRWVATIGLAFLVRPR